jgi:hypothetical protein
MSGYEASLNYINPYPGSTTSLTSFKLQISYNKMRGMSEGNLYEKVFEIIKNFQEDWT